MAPSDRAHPGLDIDDRRRNQLLHCNIDRKCESPTSPLQAARELGYLYYGAADLLCSVNPKAAAAPSVPLPTLASLCRTLACERRKQRDTSNVMFLVRFWL